ncbi:hypothetical protein F5Y11DRAFT_203691 [Daldinia sp. FL1419]|nr:hypothetical protein F5Y11DRAFT_203691 [Daldinia sp. FL1419]
MYQSCLLLAFIRLVSFVYTTYLIPHTSWYLFSYLRYLGLFATYSLNNSPRPTSPILCIYTGDYPQTGVRVVQKVSCSSSAFCLGPELCRPSHPHHTSSVSIP